MSPIEGRVGAVFAGAIRCVEYRIPRLEGIKRPGAILALALRYGLVGSAAAHYLIMTATEREAEELGPLLGMWPELVEDHVRFDLRGRLPFRPSESLPHLMARLATKPLQIHLSQHPELVSVGRCLQIVVEEFTREHRAVIAKGWPFYRAGLARRRFDELSKESLAFALRFYDRQECGIEEIPEIALIGD